MDPCKQYEPQVINHEMIARCLEEQGLKGELGRLAREEGIPWAEVDHIRLEFMNILRIDHIWVLPGLKVLSLSNNLIEDIENLHTLVHLTELDLSFNKIEKIENLDKLVNLEILNLFNNFITTIENLEELKNLAIFSIGNNKIENLDNVLYLRKFKKLKSVNMAGNPCASSPDFRIFVATFLPNIWYYEYKLIDNEEREKGNEIYEKTLNNLEIVESVEREKQEKIEAEIAEAELHSESFVEFLGSNFLFEQMFENDYEGKLLLKLGDEAKDYYTEFETQFLALTMQIFKVGQEQYKIRKDEVQQFFTITEGAKSKNQEESVEEMDKFHSIKTNLFKTIRDFKEKIEIKGSMSDFDDKIGEFRKEYKSHMHALWKSLMDLEITLYVQLEETNQNFEQTLTEMINQFIENAQGIFAQIRSTEANYLDQISEVAVRYLTTITISPDMIVPSDLAPMFVDRDTLNNVLSSSHDLHLLIIDNREDRLVNRARTWLSNLVADLQNDEIIRDRSKILEINHFLGMKKAEFEELVKLPEVNPEL